PPGPEARMKAKVISLSLMESDGTISIMQQVYQWVFNANDANWRMSRTHPLEFASFVHSRHIVPEGYSRLTLTTFPR
ncbi:MAG: hypothetical protein Q8N45_06375, partial [Anaerolineales bacterium]|nr:hypothetical protein [Anaerolineales bacterium]